MKMRQHARRVKQRLGGTVRISLRLTADLLARLGARGDPEGAIKRALRWGVAHRWRPAKEKGP